MLSRVWLSATPWTVACQASLSMGFSRQEYRSGLPFPSPGDLPDPGIKPASLVSLIFAGRFFTTSTTWEALWEHEGARNATWVLHKSLTVDGIELISEGWIVVYQFGKAWFLGEPQGIGAHSVCKVRSSEKPLFYSPFPSEGGSSLKALSLLKSLFLINICWLDAQPLIGCEKNHQLDIMWASMQ